MSNDDPFAHIVTPPLRPPLAPAVAGDQSAAGVMQSGIDVVRSLPDGEPNPTYSEGGAVDVVQSDGKLIKVVSHSTATAPTEYPEELHVVVGDLTVDVDSDGVTVTDADSGNITRISNLGVVTVENPTNTASVTISPTDLADDIVIGKDGIRVTNHTSANYCDIAKTGEVTIYNDTNGAQIKLSPVDLADNITVDKNGIKVANVTSGDYTKIANDGVVTVVENTNSKTLTIDPDLITHDVTLTEWDVCDAGDPAKALFLSSAPYAP